MSPPRTYVMHAVMVACAGAVLLAGGGALSLGALGACGGATTQDVLESNATSGSSGGTSGTSGTSGTGGSSGTSGSGDAAVDGSGQCPQEQPPNNTAETANTLAPTLCGVISPRSESDFLTFTLRPTSSSVRIDFTGKVLLKIDVNGLSITLGGGGAQPTLPFVKGHPYIIEIKGTDNSNSTPWRVDLVEK